MSIRLFCCMVLWQLNINGILSQTCPAFVIIPEESYDITYHTITEVAARPLGFVKKTQYFNTDTVDRPSKPCISADTGTGQHVEIMYETVPPSTLCVRVKGGTPDQDFGCQEKLQTCLRSTTSNIKFEFYCEVSSGCSESNVNFWARIVVGPKYDADPEGMWCHERDNKYPESLAPRPDFLTPGPTKVPSTGSTYSVAPIFIMASFVVAIFS